MSDSHLLNTNNIVNLDTYLASNYVTQDTAQTITGYKIFKSPQTVQNTNMDVQGKPDSEYTATLYFSDKVVPYGSVFLKTDTNGAVYTALGARKHSENDWSILTVGYDTNDSPFATAPRPSVNLSTTTDQIATVGWVNSTGNNVVHLDGTEIITGTKTFVNEVGIKNVNVASSNSTPTSSQHRYITCAANDGTYTSLIDCSKSTSGYSGTGIYARSGSYTSGILVSVGNDGTTTTSSPNPTDSVETATASTQIATVGWTNTKLNKKMTNCLLKVPQDIDLSVSNGTVTLAAGSKVWFPYGTSAPTLSVGSSLNGGVVSAISWNNNKLFYQVRYDTAITQTDFGSATDNIFIGVRDSSHLEYGYIGYIYSGTTPPSGGVFYNTSTNTISYYQSGSLIRSNLSLPIAFGHRTSGTVDSIDQILNGMSYCGSVVFAYPGLKGLLPNGRNSDGSLKSNEYNITVMQVTDAGVKRTSRTAILLGNNTIEPLTAYKYDLVSNYNKNTLTNSNNSRGLAAFITTDTTSPYKITSLKMKTTVQYLDESNSNLIASFGLPSSNRLELTIGASGTSYVAPANGWMLFNGYNNLDSTNSITFATLNVDGKLKVDNFVPYQGVARVYVPVQKGDTVYLMYNLGTATEGLERSFYFIYAEGEV